MSFLSPETLEEQHQQLLRNMDIDEDDELRRLNERVFGMIEQVLEEEERRELGRRIRRENPSFFMGVLNGFTNALFILVLPLIFTRILLQLLAVSTNTNDFSYDLSEYYNSQSFDPDLQDSSMLLKFHFIFASELSSVFSLEHIKYITMLFYVCYSLTMSSYMIFTFMFYLFCLMLTTSRRWNDITRFFKEVIKSKTGVF